MKKEACCLALGIGLLSEISFASGQQPSQTIVAQPHARTRVFVRKTREDRVAGLQFLALIDLAGAAAENDPENEAAETDRANAGPDAARIG